MTAPIVMSYGGGRNGTGLAIEAMRRGMRPDLILFADTGGERRCPDGRERLDYVADFSAWLLARGWPPIEVVREAKTLEQHSLDTHKLPSLAYGKRSCSVRFKHEPQERYIKSWQPALDAWAAGGFIEHWIGYHAGERTRLLGLGVQGAISGGGAERFVYPLNEWGWTDFHCLRAIRDAGLLDPGKSSCFFCPASKQAEVIALPFDHKKRAIAIEKNAAPFSGAIVGLGGSGFNWQRLIEFNDVKQGDMLRPSMPCGCYDGDSENDDEEACDIKVAA